MNFSFDILHNFFGQTNPIVIFLYIFFYEVLCAIFWPTPSEAPLLLYPKFSLFAINVVCALGKGIGAYLVCKGYDILEVLFKRLHIDRFLMVSPRVQSLILKKGFWAYLLIQSVPFMPMRTGIYIYSFTTRNGFFVAFGAFVGTIIRNYLMFFLVMLGYISLRKLYTG